MTGMRSQGQDLEEIMAVEVEAAEETTEGKEREEAIIGGMTVGKEEEGKEPSVRHRPRPAADICR